MGNHFRTSGDEQSASQAPMPQANGAESKGYVPDFQSDPLAQHAASAGDASAAARGKPHAQHPFARRARAAACQRARPFGRSRWSVYALAGRHSRSVRSRSGPRRLPQLP